MLRLVHRSQEAIAWTVPLLVGVLATPALPQSSSQQNQARGAERIPANSRALLDHAARTGAAEVKRNLAQSDKVFTALRDKNWQLLSEVMPEDHIQHSPGIPTGRSGLVRFFSRLPMSPDVYKGMAHVVAEGPYVVIHRTVSRRGEMVAVDIMRFDEQGQYIEHWDLFQPVPKEAASARALWDDAEPFRKPVDIPAAKARKNKQLVLDFLELAFKQGEVEAAVSKFVGDVYIEHRFNVKDGPDSLVRWLRAPTTPRFDYEPQIAVAQNDLVAVFSRVNVIVGDASPVEHAVVDLMRVRNARIVEHWEVAQPLPQEMAHK